MASQAEYDELPAPGVSTDPSGRRRRLGCLALLAVLLLLAVGLALLWANRESIVDNVITDELDKRGIEASYTIERIGGRRQVLRDVVVGDPARPDLTVERAEVIIDYRFGFPKISGVRLVRPRLFGTYRRGKLSFGALDPLLFTGDKQPFEFPDLALAVEDGRALLESDYGPVALKLAGEGHLQDGFLGELAALGPRLAFPGCEPLRVTLYGRVEIEAERPRFEGPVRFGGVACRAQGLAIAGGALQLQALADRALEKIEGEARLRIGSARWGGTRVAALGGTSGFTWRDGGLTARYDLSATELATEQAAVARLDFDGTLRARRYFEWLELDTELDGRGVRLGPGLDATLADAAHAAGDTLLGPILEQARARLAREARGSRLTATATVRRTAARTSAVVPRAVLRGGSGSILLSLSRFQLTTGDGNAPRFSGNFSTGGEGLPRFAGRMEQSPGGAGQVRLAMAEYRAGDSRLAIPELVLLLRPDGAVGFSGQVRASGALPGGRAENLVLPLAGSRSSAGVVALWNGCTDLRFDRLQLANLTLARQRLTLCPPRGTSIVRLDSSGLRIAAGASSLQVAGRLGETPIAIRSGPVGLAYPGALSARQLVVTLGPTDTATRFAVADLTAQIGKDIAGRFTEADVRLFAVPLDLLGASGTWRYADGRLTIADGAFRLADRQTTARFVPLTAVGATLTLEDNLITAQALLREPKTDREVTRVDIRHDLASGRGSADLAVVGLTFDDRLQPAPTCVALNGVATVLETAKGPAGLSCLAYGVVALVRGTVTGTGRIDWNEAGVTSSGRFSSDSLDFAAAFGPVKGASGTIEFTDLLGLTTAPNQRLQVASINPGIEVTGGEIAIQLRNGELLALQGGTWPFMGGTLTLRPVDIRFASANTPPGAGEVRRYVLEIEGLDAARFVERMELNNIAATGIFDGTVPIVFDGSGNGRLEGGLLLSRPPGGNVSYVGELTYEDLGAMANFAFDTLRSLDYRQMSVAMDGPLTGEIVTRVRLDGVSQGAGAKKNILTRAIAGLPIRLEVNLRAPFYGLISSTRALYDPAAILDPRSAEVGLLDAQGNLIRRETDTAPPPPLEPEDLTPDEAAIQRRESEELP